MRKHLLVVILLLSLISYLGCSRIKENFKAQLDVGNNMNYNDSISSDQKPKRNPQLNSNQWLLKSIYFYRGLGFFPKYHRLTDEEVLTQLKAVYKKEVGKDWNSDMVSLYPDLQLLFWDKERVWFEDTEADVGMGNNVYVETLKKWAKISQGAFQPTGIKETWGGEDGPVGIEFKQKGKPYVIQASYYNDFIDMAILKDINLVIEDTGYQFYFIADDPQTYFVVALTKEQKAKLERDRGIEFDKFAQEQ